MHTHRISFQEGNVSTVHSQNFFPGKKCEQCVHSQNFLPGRKYEQCVHSQNFFLGRKCEQCAYSQNFLLGKKFCKCAHCAHISFPEGNFVSVHTAYISFPEGNSVSVHTVLIFLSRKEILWVCTQCSYFLPGKKYFQWAVCLILIYNLLIQKSIQRKWNKIPIKSNLIYAVAECSWHWAESYTK